jgi:tetratricopeptide (TPR) repeat protein
MVVQDPLVGYNTARAGSLRRLELTVRGGNTFAFVETAPLEGTSDQLTLWAQVITCKVLGAGDKVQELDEESWQQKRHQLREELQRSQLGGVIAVAAEDALFWVRRQAEFWESKNEWANAIRYLDRLLAAEPSSTHYERRAFANASLGQYGRARSDYKQAEERGEGAGQRRSIAVWRVAGTLALLNGDLQEYRHACSAALARVSKGTEGNWTEALDLCLLSPEAAQKTTKLLPRAIDAAALSPQDGDALHRLGAALFRTGQAAPAAQRLTEANRRLKNAPKTSLFLALAHHRLGHQEEARKWLNDTVQWLAEENPLPWLEQLEAQLLRREAEAAFGRTSPVPGRGNG